MARLLTSGFLFGLVGSEETFEVTWAVPLPAVEIIPDSQFASNWTAMILVPYCIAELLEMDA